MDNNGNALPIPPPAKQLRIVSFFAPPATTTVNLSTIENSDNISAGATADSLVSDPDPDLLLVEEEETAPEQAPAAVAVPMDGGGERSVIHHTSTLLLCLVIITVRVSVIPKLTPFFR